MRASTIGTTCLIALLCTACIADSIGVPKLTIDRIDFAPVAAVLLEGDTIRFAAIPRDSTGRIVPRTKAHWSSARPEIVSIDSLGLVRGISAGRTSIRVVVDTIRAETEVVVMPRAGTAIFDLDAGAEHTCAVTNEGEVLCWGGNTFGQLGDTGTSQSATAIRVAGLSDVKAVVAGSRHTCAARASYGLWCWGSNSAGQLGDTLSSRKSNAQPLARFDGVSLRQISAGSAHSCAVDAEQVAHCWGSNSFGQLAVPSGSRFKSITAGHGHSCGILVDDTVRCWGWNQYGQLGQTGSTQFRSITAGYGFTCALALSGVTYCWGFGGEGQLGHGGTASSTLPVVVNGPALAQIDAGSYHICGVTPDGAAYCWGRNVNGEVAAASSAAVLAPFRVSVPALRLVRAGASHSCGVTVAGAFLCWGDAGDGRLGVR